mmetsp:Transcript_49146/g.105753  ORF Transcript_49146/g.105753 Transcript_49146/m.105753 type:complete len:126 (-) Transcript_49146:1202-1579(-)
MQQHCSRKEDEDQNQHYPQGQSAIHETSWEGCQGCKDRSHADGAKICPTPRPALRTATPFGKKEADINGQCVSAEGQGETQRQEPKETLKVIVVTRVEQGITEDESMRKSSNNQHAERYWTTVVK